MGLTVQEIEVGRPAAPDVFEPVEFLMDSGAIYSVVPAPVLQRPGIPCSPQEGDIGAFTLEALGLALGPLRREVRPLPILPGGRPRR